MKKLLFTIIITSIVLGFSGNPSHALSPLGEDFIKACTALDSPFPPRGWERDDLRYAALEVLDAIEDGYYDDWPLDFCILAIGSTQYPEDLPRIFAYKDDWLDTIIRSLKGFSNPIAINFLLDNLNHKEATMREIVVYSLADMDFRKLDEPANWKNKVISKIKSMRQKEKAAWLKKDIDICLEKLEKAKTDSK